MIDSVFNPPSLLSDVHVGAALVDRCLLGLLKHKTRVLVTHHLHLLLRADRVLAMDHGRVARTISPSSEPEKLGALVAHVKPGPAQSERKQGATTDDADADEKSSATAAADAAAKAKATESEKDEDESGERALLIVREGRELGAVRARVVRTYLRFVGFGLTALIFLSMVTMQASRNFSDWCCANITLRSLTKIVVL